MSGSREFIEQVIKLNFAVQHMEATGAWFMASIFRKQLEKLFESNKSLDGQWF